MEQNQIKQTFQDRTLSCVDCGESFVWTAGNQAFYRSKSLSQPRRCPSCCALRKSTLCPSPQGVRRA